jgi:hypothetical protein
VVQPEGKTVFKIIMLRWKDNVKMDLKIELFTYPGI